MAKRGEETTEKSESRPARWEPFRELEGAGGWSPFRELAMGRPGRLGRLFEEMLGERDRSWAQSVVVAVDCSEDEKAYLITAELPGAKSDDVHIELQDDVLTIRGEKKSEREGKTDHRRWSERVYGSFSRSFTLPSNALADKVDASFKDGVLTVTIPKGEESKPRTVTIKG
jgi:HSP20 family protein